MVWDGTDDGADRVPFAASADGVDRVPIASTDGVRPDADAYVDLAADLRAAIDGAVQFDEYAQLLYATDGSIYQARPAGVVHPTGLEDVQATVEVATAHEVPLLPRGAGSSLAGQAVGPGCVVLDFTTYMDEIREISPEERLATVQPGVVLDHLDARLADHGLQFALDPASSNRATVGGAIGNNSTGAHSVRYGLTDAFVEELLVVLSDGSLVRTREVVLDSDEYAAIVAKDDLEAHLYETVRSLVTAHETAIEDRYPDLKRSVTGYNLQKVISENDDGEAVIDLGALFVGAEGTLGIVVETTLSLVSTPEETAVALYCFDDLIETLRAVPQALEYPVSAVELLDEEVFRLAGESEGYAAFAEPIPEGTAAALMLEWDDELLASESPPAGESTRSRDRFEAAVAETTTRFVDEGAAFDVIEAYTDDDQSRLWTLRKAAIPLLMSMAGDPKPYPFIEDATVPPADLAEYVAGFEAILDDHGTSAAYFAHAGSGTLHIRPILNLKADAGVQTMHAIADDVTDLVLAHNGAFSGEHGDGMARTEFTPKMYGDQLWQAFKELKTAFDPAWLFHPGNVVYRDSADDVGPDTTRGVGADMREHLRYGPDYQSLEPQTTLEFSPEGGFSHLVELCNGCGTCRQTQGETMCPTYRATGDEIQTTRGRANLLRAAISGELDESELYTERFQQAVLEQCIGCKGCKSDCPTGVDLAKLKAELAHQYHQREGASLRDRFFANADRVAAAGSATAPVSNLFPRLPGARVLLEKTLGISADRVLPTFRRETFEDWFAARPDGTPADADRSVVLVPDTDTNYCDPAPGKAAVAVLEAAGVDVTVPADLAPTGRAAYSTGMLDLARRRAERNVEVLRSFVEEGTDVVFVEPSDAVMVQDEYRSLVDDADRIADAADGICAYLDRHRLDERLTTEVPSTRLTTAVPSTRLTYHGHCHQKALGTAGHAVSLLERVGYDVDPLDSGCCGMAGSFGYEAEHDGLSRAIGRLLVEQVADSPGEVVTAPGTSCRTQLEQLCGGPRPPHPIELVDAARTDSVRAGPGR